MIINVTDNIQLTLVSSFDFMLTACALIALSVTIHLSFKRLQNTPRFFVVLLLNLISFCSLVGLISDTKVQSDISTTASLLTYGTSQQQIDSLILNENTTVFVLSSTLNWQNSFDLSRVKGKLINIENVSDIFLIKPFYHQLNVFGDGLHSAQWQAFESSSDSNFNASTKYDADKWQVANVNFYPSLQRTGLIDLQWPKQLVLGQPFYISGMFLADIKDENRIFTITLTDLHDEVVDEVLVKNRDKFNLSALLKNQGLFNYQLKIFNNDNELISEEDVTFSVSSSERIKVAIKQSSPSFESKHLKNWLAEQGEEILVLTKISKDKYIKQIINSADIQNEQKINENKSIVLNKLLSRSWLKDYALLYMDGRAFLSLSKEEIDELNSAIKQGLGFMIIVDDELLSASKTLSSNALYASVLNSLAIKTNAPNERESSTVPVWLYSQEELLLAFKDVQLSVTDNSNVLIKSSKGEPLLHHQAYGLGTLAVSLINESYKWNIAGEKSHYSHYWQTIIKQVSRHEQRSGWQNSPKGKVYFQGQLNEICTQLNVSDANKIQVKGINLLKSAVTESKYCGAFWANVSGWHQFTMSHEESDNNQTLMNTQHAFIYEQDDWLTWQQALKNKASLLVSEKITKNTIDSIYTPLSKFYVWLLLLFTSSLLWYEKKKF